MDEDRGAAGVEEAGGVGLVGGGYASGECGDIEKRDVYLVAYASNSNGDGGCV